jgi:hypothetical protein
VTDRELAADLADLVPKDLRRLLKLGFHPAKLTIIIEIANRGGTATTTEVRQWVPGSDSFLQKQLAALVAAGYLTTDGRRGKTGSSTFNLTGALATDIKTLASVTQPRSG